jgi:long-chain acyl-CoA synthetase
MAAPAFGRNLIELFETAAAKGGDKPFLWAKQDGRYAPWSWQEVARQVQLLAKALRAKGLAPGDRVLIVSENRPEWAIADLAIVTAGGITVPAYTTNTPDDHAHLLQDSGARMAVVAHERLAERLLPAVRQQERFDLLVAIEPFALPAAGPEDDQAQPELLSWEAALKLGAAEPEPAEKAAASLKTDDVACLIYTSGTGGRPKGVMLTHGNIMTDVAGAYEVLAELGLGNEVFLSFLPLSHAYEHTAGLFFPIALDAEIYFAEGLEQLSTNLAEARPTVMTCVPRLYEVMRQRILNTIGRQKGLKPWLFLQAVRIGSKGSEDPDSLTWLERLVEPLLDRLVRTKVKDRFGGRMKALVSGGAPLNYDVGLFFTALGLPLFQGYGQTECSPVISVNRPSRVKLKTVGPPLKGLEVKIAEDGEILVRGGAVMPGYWNDPAATAQTLKDGWLLTGDVGEIDDDGYITITDRKRDLIVNSGGDNIAPQRVEGVIELEPEIGQVLVYGDRRPHLVALVVPDKDFARNFSRAEGKPAELEILVEDDAFQEVIGAAIKRANQRLSVLEKIRRFRILPTPFSVENGTMTPTMKLKRQVIYRSHQAVLAELYKGRV